MTLFVLTGKVQQGKTRWLETQLAALQAAGVGVHGLLAPGIWEPAAVSEEHPHGFEKRGIDWVFYPTHERLTYAVRTDLLAETAGWAQVPPTFDGSTMEWTFSTDAFARANAFFAALGEGGEGEASGAASGAEAARLLVVDEIGRLEVRGRGLAQAVTLIEQAQAAGFSHALAVVREALVESVLDLPMAQAWGSDVCVITPDDAGRAVLLGAFGIE